MHTAEAQAIIDRRKREQAERFNGDRPLFDTAWTKGDFRLAEPGAEVWARTDGDITQVRMNPAGEARGGIILEVTADPDPETGEMRRAFRCFDYTSGPTWRAVTVLTEAQVDPNSFSPPDWARIRGLYRRLCREVGVKRGTASCDEIDMVQDAAHLAAIIGQVTPR